ncbi:MAG TPA: NAD-dependent epimerase/dehydratase family protein [Opitutales bacterium]|jgi:nucleoside-diphosphate-sugar epimerase|nr:NAD-dependent epimerase/dehydratase family protein [Opitutales bacterium]
MRVLVTGGGGFLGQEVVRQLLAKSIIVRSLGRSPQPGLATRGVEVMQGDLTDADTVARAVAGCDAIVHTAAKAGIWGSWDEYYRPNVLGTQNVLAAMRKHGVAQLVYTSTPSVVFNGESHAGVDESQPYGQNFPCHYPRTKAMAEQAVLQANDGEKMRVIALRPHLIWGAGDPHLVPRILARAHRLRIVGPGTNRVDLTHVRHAAQAHILALDALSQARHPAQGRAFFISDGAPVVLWDWINALLQKLGRPPITRRISLRTARTVGSGLEVLWRVLPFFPGEPPMTRFLAAELAKDHWYSISAARKLLNFNPTPELAAEMNALIMSLQSESKSP